MLERAVIDATGPDSKPGLASGADDASFPQDAPEDRRAIRSIFISDVHLGCKYSQADALRAFLKGKQPEYLYIVGDFIDGWRLKRGWYWEDAYSLIVKRIVNLMKRGAKVIYLPGNHDEFLRNFISNLGSIRIVDEIVHTAADGRRFLVLHGDQFDVVVRNARLLALLGDVGYNFLLWINRHFNVWRRRLGFGYWSLSGHIKHRVKQATNFIGNFEEAVVRYAASKGCAGVICGHIHTAAVREKLGVQYLNTGDWVESCTAVVEYADGTFALVHQPLPEDAALADEHPHETLDPMEEIPAILSLAGRREFPAELVRT